jgi:hypothetical protein
MSYFKSSSSFTFFGPAHVRRRPSWQRDREKGNNGDGFFQAVIFLLPVERGTKEKERNDAFVGFGLTRRGNRKRSEVASSQLPAPLYNIQRRYSAVTRHQQPLPYPKGAKGQQRFVTTEEERTVLTITSMRRLMFETLLRCCTRRGSSGVELPHLPLVLLLTHPADGKQ